MKRTELKMMAVAKEFVKSVSAKPLERAGRPKNKLRSNTDKLNRSTEQQCNIADVSISVCPKCHASEVYENRNGDGECAVCGHTWQTGC